MAQNPLIFVITVIESIIFWLALRTSDKQNQTIKFFVIGIMIGIFSFIQAIEQFKTRVDYNLFDLVIFYAIFITLATAIFITIVVLSSPKSATKVKTKTISTNEPVILTIKNSINIIAENKVVLKVTVGEAGIYFYHLYSGKITAHYFNYFDVFGYWKAGETSLLTGINCLEIIELDHNKPSITIQTKPGYQISFLV